MPLNTKMELHDTPTSKLAEMKATVTNDPLNGDNRYAVSDICKMIEFLVDNICQVWWTAFSTDSRHSFGNKLSPFIG